MPRFQVTWYERTQHTVEIEAPDEDAAYDWERILAASETENGHDESGYECDLLSVEPVEETDNRPD